MEAPLIIRWSEKFEKRLAGMRAAGGNDTLAAGNADRVIEMLKREGIKALLEPVRRTRYGEKRLKDCYKFNLGNGYRLISVKRDNLILLLYLGSHDECDAWLEKNRGRFSFAVDEDRGLSYVMPEADTVAEAPAGCALPERDEYEERLAEKIDDKILRRIFSGLLGSELAK